MCNTETPEYFRLKSLYGKAVAERYKNLIGSPEYRTTEENTIVRLDRNEWEERRGRPLSHCQKIKEPLPSCLNTAGVRLTSAKRKKILGAIAIFPSLYTHNYQFQLIPRTLFATAKELGWRYNIKLERWELLDNNIESCFETDKGNGDFHSVLTRVAK
jgi:hypothetical protein